MNKIIEYTISKIVRSLQRRNTTNWFLGTQEGPFAFRDLFGPKNWDQIFQRSTKFAAKGSKFFENIAYFRAANEVFWLVFFDDREGNIEIR